MNAKMLVAQHAHEIWNDALAKQLMKNGEHGPNDPVIVEAIRGKISKRLFKSKVEFLKHIVLQMPELLLDSYRSMFICDSLKKWRIARNFKYKKV